MNPANEGTNDFAMRKRKVILAEFAITVYTDGNIDWDRFDRFLWQLLHPKAKI